MPLVPFRPPQLSLDYFRDLLHRLAQRPPPARLVLAGPTPFAALPEDVQGLARTVPVARLLVMLAGRQRYAVSHAGTRVTCDLGPGEALYWCPHAWQVESWDRPVAFFGLVLRPDMLRVIVVDHPGGGLPPSAGTPWGYHSAQPLAGTGREVQGLLDELCLRDPGASAAPCLFQALLHLASEFLQADQAPTAGNQKALRTWQRVASYLEEHYTEELTRAGVAQALGLHPNYLSALALRQTGQSFHHAVASLRLAAAKRLLLSTDFKLAHVAERCGYQSPAYFVTAFRRATGQRPTAFRLQRK